MTDYTGERIHLGLVTANFATSRPEGMKRENYQWYSGGDCHVEKVKTIKKLLTSLYVANLYQDTKFL